MQFIPTHCEICSRSALTSADCITEGVTLCSECGGTARSLPGESYTEEDGALFVALATTLREAGLTPFHAGLLGAELESRNLLAPGRCLDRITQALPSLAIVDLVVPGNTAALRKAEGMLATLLEVMAHARSQSGVVPAVQLPTRKAGNEGR